MLRIISIFLTMFSFFLSGKETKKITVTSLYPPYKEVFYALKSDPSVKHGEYLLISEGKILIQGYYKTGKKDSLWTEFTIEGKTRYKGCYKQDVRVGIWEYYNNKEELEQKIDFTDNSMLLYRTQYANHPFRIIFGSDTISTVLDRPPLFLGGETRIKEIINSEIEPPLHKSNDKTIGTVYVEFTIDSTGKSANHHILKGLGPGCNIEALRVIKLIPDEWFPGVYQGKFVTVNYMIPVFFNKTMFTNNSNLR